jgi:hypothetical protein
MIRGMVTGSEIKGVASGMAELIETNRQQARELGIDEKSHAAGSGWKRLILARRAA